MSLLRRMANFPNLCTFCKYHTSGSYLPDGRCDVFNLVEKEIPLEIYTLKYDHRYPHPEDGGIQFAAKTIEELQTYWSFRNLSPEQIEERIQIIIEKLDRLHEKSEPPSNEGHLPSLWFMYDD